MAYYYEHQDLRLPPDTSIIWRYMDLWKFNEMLRRGSVFFSRADKQTDDLEGEYPEGLLAEMERRFPGRFRSCDGQTYSYLEVHTQKGRRSRLLSCWSLGATETKRMWVAYTNDCQASIAVRSTVGRLKDCFHDRVEPVVWIGKVRYGQQENALPSPPSRWRGNHFLYPFFAKREEFRWENEIRATVDIALARQPEFGGNSVGCHIAADLALLIEAVWLSPQSPNQVGYDVRTHLETSGLGQVGVHKSSWDLLP